MTTETASAKDPGIQYDSVKAWDAGIGEMDRTRAVVFVPRAEVRGLELAYAAGAERPLVTILLGIAVLAVSVIPILYLLAVLVWGGTLNIKIFLILGLTPLGLWLLRFALKKRLVLVVHTAKGRRKMVFQGSTDLDAIRDFVHQAGNRYGYSVELSDTLIGLASTPQPAVR
ncbi:MAG: hypothetical protein ACJ76Y_05630 [Thermoanaerobaculia bacterium]